MAIIGAFPTTLQNGTPEDATQVMALFNYIQSQTNGNACPATGTTSVLKGDGSGGTVAAIAGTDYATGTQASGGLTWGGTSTGTANAQVISPAIAVTSLTAGMSFTFIAGFTNTGPMTLAVSAVTAQNVYKKSSAGPVALVANDVVAGNEYRVTWDGVQFELENIRPYAQGSAVASAATLALTGLAGDYVQVTGTTSITAITMLQGDCVTLEFAAPLTLTNGASLILPGGANIVTQAGDCCILRGESSGVVRCIAYFPATGFSVVSKYPQIQPSVTPTLSAGAMTLPSLQYTLDFRNVSLGSGGTTTITGTPAALTIPSGATLGTINAVQSTLVLAVLNNSGTLEYAVANIAGGLDMSETGLISTNAISGTATANNVWYSNTARSNVPYRIVEIIQSTQATAGTWATAPSLVQGVGGEAFTAFSGFGQGQTWKTASFVNLTTYYNTSSNAIVVYQQASLPTGGTLKWNVNGIDSLGYISNANSSATVLGSTAIVPAGGYFIPTGNTALSFSAQLS